MRRTRGETYYYGCLPEFFIINTEDECISFNHVGDDIEIAFYEIAEVGIDFDEDDDYVLKIRCHEETHYFQFAIKTEALKLCIKILNQILLLPERRGTSVSS